MPYATINNLPIDLNFDTKTNKELRLYGDWFWENKEQRLQVLQDAVKDTAGFEDWEMDFTPQSLKPLYQWFCIQVETEKLTEEEYQEARESTPKDISIEDWQFTLRTLSLFIDIGFYFGEVFIHQHGLKWEQFLARSKLDINRGHMVIAGFGKKYLEPTRVIENIGYGSVRRGCEGDRYFDMYNIWKKYSLRSHA